MEEDKYKRYSDIIKNLQEHLGEICDINRNIIAMRELNKDNKSDIAQFQIGMFTGLQITRSEKLIEHLKDYHLKI
jgi:DNA repair exonuclease SbcCD ATPase subunit